MRVKIGIIKYEIFFQINDMEIVEKFGKNEVLSVIRDKYIII